jgi:transcriptional regulator with XRE-family HTH domain
MSDSATSSPTAGLEPVSLWLLGEPFSRRRGRGRCCRHRVANRSPFGAAFTAWRYDRDLTLAQAAKRLGVNRHTAHTWGLHAMPERSQWATLRAHGIDPAPFYQQPARVRKPPAAERQAMGRAIAAWLATAGVDVGVELDVADQTLKNWMAGRNMPRPTTMQTMQALGFSAPSEAA